MDCAGDVYNDSPTSANKFGDGAAPSASLGLSSDLGVYLPFGSLAYHLVRGVKADDKSELVAIPGTALWTKPQHPKKTTP